MMPASRLRRPGLGSWATFLHPASLTAAFFCLLFFLEGLVFIPYVGLQNDEAIFSGTIYPPVGILYAVRIFRKRQIPLMILSYMGTLKAFLYKPVFSVFGPSVWSVRIPALLAGAATVWLLYLLVRRIAGTRAALAACALLATDAAFVLTTCMDWGPVAIQHLLLLGGMMLLLRFHDSGRVLFLAAGFFVFGVALWDKALFTWALAGLAAGAAAVFPRHLRAKITRRNLAVAAVSLLVGAAPLVVYNIARRMETFRGNARFSSEGMGQKATLLEWTIDGSAMFGYMVRNEPPPGPVRPRSAMETLSIRLSDLCGQRQKGFLRYACILALGLLPWLWRTPARKPMVFALIFMVVVWLQMAFTKDAGTSAHHTVLLWPFPHLLAGVGLAQASQALRRGGLAALAVVLAVVCGSNLVVSNQYLAQLVENGPTTVWTDAINPLAAYLGTSPARHMYVTDWGIINSLRILDAGRLPLDPAPEESAGDPKSHAAALKTLESQDSIFVGHTAGNESVPGANARLDALAGSGGYRPEILSVIADRNRRPIFQVYRYMAAGR